MKLILLFSLFFSIIMYANEFETKEKQKSTKIEKKLQHLRLTTGLEGTGSDVLQISTLYFKHILAEAENTSYS